MYLTSAEKEVYHWIDNCPFACESYVDEEGNIVATVLITEEDED